MRPSLSPSPFMARGREESPSSGELLKREKKRLLCNQFTSSSKLVTNSDLLCQIGSAALLLAAEGSASQPATGPHTLCWIDFFFTVLSSPEVTSAQKLLRPRELGRQAPLLCGFLP